MVVIQFKVVIQFMVVILSVAKDPCIFLCLFFPTERTGSNSHPDRKI
jgi:hypothetical protein